MARTGWGDTLGSVARPTDVTQVPGPNSCVAIRSAVSYCSCAEGSETKPAGSLCSGTYSQTTTATAAKPVPAVPRECRASRRPDNGLWRRSQSQRTAATVPTSAPRTLSTRSAASHERPVPSRVWQVSVTAESTPHPARTVSGRRRVSTPKNATGTYMARFISPCWVTAVSHTPEPIEQVADPQLPLVVGVSVAAVSPARDRPRSTAAAGGHCRRRASRKAVNPRIRPSTAKAGNRAGAAEREASIIGLPGGGGPAGVQCGAEAPWRAVKSSANRASSTTSTGRPQRKAWPRRRPSSVKPRWRWSSREGWLWAKTRAVALR